MLAVARTHVQFAAGLVIDLAHFGHARLSLVRSDKPVAALILQLGRLTLVLH